MHRNKFILIAASCAIVLDDILKLVQITNFDILNTAIIIIRIYNIVLYDINNYSAIGCLKGEH